MEQNKTTKYFKYALGEIILVVLGILIALQINNWNTQKNETKELNGFLQNIKKNVNSDLEVLNWIKKFRDSSVTFSKEYEKRLTNNYTFDENATVDDIKRLALYVFRDRYFYSNKSGFDALKNSGYLSKIQTTKLEDYLNAYYFKVDRIIEQEKSLNNFIENMQVTIYEDNTAQEFFRLPGTIIYSSMNLEDKNRLNQLYSHPSISGANMLNRFMIQLITYYDELQEEGELIVSEINAWQEQ
jgi:hypothetical protein